MKKYSRSDHPAFNGFLRIVSLLGLLFFLLFSMSRPNLSEIPWITQWHGLWQRLFVVSYYAMLMVVTAKQALETKVLCEVN
jgi:hypothetical protein